MDKNFKSILIIGGAICLYLVWKASKTPKDVNLDQVIPDETDSDGNIVIVGEEVDGRPAPVPCESVELILDQLVNASVGRPNMEQLREQAIQLNADCEENKFIPFTGKKNMSNLDKFIKS